MKKSIIVAIIVVVLVIIGLFFYFRPANQIKIIEVEAAKVEIGSLSKIVSASGNLKPEREISLTSERGDIVKEILKRVGDEVKKDDVLIRFENNFESKSPIEGKVLTLDVVEGQRMQVSQALPAFSGQQTAIITIADFDPLIVEVEIDETDIINIAKEQETKITLDAYPDKELSGKVVEIGISPLQAMPGESPTYLAEIEIQDSQGIYPRAGLSSDVEIKVETKEDILYVPYEAVFEEDNKYFVFEVENEMAKKTEVKIGLETDDYYETVSGLEKGDMVIVSDLDKVVDGQKVKIK